MDRNIVYLYEKILSLDKSREFDFAIFKNFLSLYSQKIDLRDESFLNGTNLLDRNVLTASNNVLFDYKKHLDCVIPDDAQKIIFLNGFYKSSENLSSDVVFQYGKLNSGIFLDELIKFYSDSVYDKLNFFHILNSILFNDGVYIFVPDDVVVDKPLYILNFFDSQSSNAVVNPKVFLSVGKNSHINVMENYFDFSSNLFINASTCLLLKQFSLVNYYLSNSFASFKSRSFFSQQLESSILKYNDFSFGGSYYKGYYNFILDDVNCSLKNYMCKHIKGLSVDDVVCRVFHLGSVSKSDVNYCVLGNGKSKIFFTGSIMVGVDLNKIDANLKCDGLLLSDFSNITLVPELSISSNDIKCSHGATVGYIDSSIMFYMRSRGIYNSECLKIVLSVFLDRCIDKKNLFFDVLNEKIVCEYFNYE